MYAIILAGGHGTRMNSILPKVLHRINNVPILSRIVYQLKKLDNIEKIFVVVNPSTHVAIADTLIGQSDNIEYVVQHNPQGTGHAVQEVLKNISYEGDIMVCCGDMPLLHSQVITDFISAAHPFGFIAFHKNNPTGYGRVITTGETVQIVEEKDCIPEQRSVTLVNSGTYLFPCGTLQKVIHRLAPNNAQHELYLTDAIALLQKEGLECNVHILPNHMAYMMEGVNTRADLDRLQDIFVRPCGLLQENKDIQLKDVLYLLQHLTVAPYDQEKVEERYKEILQLYPYIQVYTVYHPLTGLMGLGTLVVEPKFIHDCGKVGRIEDVVVHPYFRREGLGSYIIEHLVSRAKQEGCYKVVLDAGPHNHGFYSGLDFVHKENHYEKRF